MFCMLFKFVFWQLLVYSVGPHDQFLGCGLDVLIVLVIYFLEGSVVVIFPFLYHQSLTISHLVLLVTVIFFDSLKFSLLYFSGFTSVCFFGVLSICLLDFLSVLLSLLSRSWIYFHIFLISLCEVSLRLISFTLDCCVVLHFNHFCIF